jgi:hypothetical protein
MRELLLKYDPQIKETVGGMMGKEMLMYCTQADSIMKYALSSVKTHISFHSMVMYGSSERFGGSGLREKYEKLLPKAKFQKGCVNFKSLMEMPIDIATSFIKEMAKVEYPPPEYKDRMIAAEKKRLAAQKKK